MSLSPHQVMLKVQDEFFERITVETAQQSFIMLGVKKSRKRENCQMSGEPQEAHGIWHEKRLHIPSCKRERKRTSYG